MAEQEASAKKGRNLAVKAANISVRFMLDLVIYILFAAALIFIIRASYDFCYQIFGDASVDEKKNAVYVEFSISDSISRMELAKELEDDGLILNRYSFYVKMRLDRFTVQKGEYELNSSMNYTEILKALGAA